MAQKENGAVLGRRRALALEAAPAGRSRRFLPCLVMVPLVACGGATRPNRDDSRQQRDEASSADSARSQRDAGEDVSPRFCTANIAPALYVTFDKQAMACDEFVVVATDGGYTDALKCSDLDTVRCACFGANERPGTYEITVSRREPFVELARSEPITATATSCHVVTQSVVLQFASLPVDAGTSLAPDAAGK